MTKVLELCLYMEKEEDFPPWSMMLNSISSILDLFSSNPHYDKLKEFLKKIMSPMLTKLGLNDEGTVDRKDLRYEVKALAVKLGFQEYVDWVKNSFKKAVNGTKLIVEHELLVYRYAVRYGGDEEWKYVMDMALRPNASFTQKHLGLEALGYTTDRVKMKKWVLRSALNFASDGEVIRERGREFQRKGPEKAKADLAKECLTRVKKKRE
ncbi:hypothetical protein HELRODRAFT_177605 [Helobdella robusta]|uniref:ERAP1-like C-terminal domain-containing protein n=1 Tax=Helobdella robusta TaxID=6412 RepID=T1FBX6_HELRO|nr:hypothetical protein HELRODRAFT_177605 [Helobdella robusta]ESN97940.1 hypothetical protein HELRODRAFT_177605 [Helobdella robusta]